jgi:hypothetical protein
MTIRIRTQTEPKPVLELEKRKKHKSNKGSRSEAAHRKSDVKIHGKSENAYLFQRHPPNHAQALFKRNLLNGCLFQSVSNLKQRQFRFSVGFLLDYFMGAQKRENVVLQQRLCVARFDAQIQSFRTLDL